MKLKNLFLTLDLLLILGFGQHFLGQVNQDWVARYNGSGNSNDEAHSIVVDGSGNVYATGWGWTAQGLDYITIKYNSSGVQQWVQTYNGPGNSLDEASSIAVDGSGNVYVTGRSTGSGTDYDYATIKYSSSGVQQWVQRYNGYANFQDEAKSIAIDASGNVYVTGWSIGNGTDKDYATIKYNSSGVQQWVQRYNGPPGNLEDAASSIAVDASGNVHVTGWSTGNGTYRDYATVKYNSSGFQQWVQRFDQGITDEATSITVDGSGNVYVTGSSTGNGTGLDYATIKYDASGTPQWGWLYNGPGSAEDIATSIKVDGSGNVYITGWSTASGSDKDYATIKYDASGTPQWLQRYNGSAFADDFAYSMALDVLGDVYVTGASVGGGLDFNYATVKYNSSGDEQWVKSYNGPALAHDWAYSIAVDGSGKVYVTGGSEQSGSGNRDYATIKYSQPIGIEIISSEIPGQYNVYQNYPNPFNPVTNVKFQMPKSGFVKLVVFDILGRVVAVLVNEELKPGTYKVEWDASNVPSGVYFYRINAEGNSQNFSKTLKMILVK